MPQGTDYRKVAQQIAAKYGLGPWFLRQISQESGFNPGARSGAGAVGIAQIVPRYHPDVDPNTPGNQAAGANPVVDLNYAAQLDKNLINKYGSVERALSAYNSGRPDKYLDPNFAGGQTYNYVRSILSRGQYGSRNAGVPPSPSNPPSPRAGGVPSPIPGAPLSAGNPLLQIIQSTRKSLGMEPRKNDPLSTLLAQRSASQPQPSAQPLPYTPGTPAPFQTLPARQGQTGGGSIVELLHEGVGGPTHSTGEHIHVALSSPQAELAAIQEAQRRGLSVRENPYTDPVDPVHTRNSYHYRTFPGRYGGKQLGQAADVSGPGMSAYEAWVRSRYGRKG